MIAALIPILSVALPSLIKVAEHIIVPGSKPLDIDLGVAKKKFVMDMLGFAWDNLGAKIFPDIQNIDEKKIFLRMCDVLIEELVPQLTQ